MLKQELCDSGVMVATLRLERSAFGRRGSSPLCRTMKKINSQEQWVISGLYYKDFPKSVRDKFLANPDILKRLTPLIIDTCHCFPEFASRAKGK